MPVRDNKTTHRCLYTCEGCCANYRVAVGHLGTNAIQQLYLNMPIRGLYCMNYRVVVSHLRTNTILQLYLNIPISGPYCFNYRIVIGHLGTNAIQQLYLNMPISSPYCMNYRVAVGPLIGQGCERSELPCLADGIIKQGRRSWSFYVYHICCLVDRRIRGQMLLMRSIVFSHSRPTSR